MKATQPAALRDAPRPYDRSAPIAHSESFVITLCSLPVPITISRPRSRYLSGVRFFSSRRRGQHPEAYWVHMGYFSSRRDAQRWLRLLHGEYPEAFIRDAHSLVLHDSSMRAPAAARRGLAADRADRAARSAHRPSSVRHRGPRAGVCR